MRFSVDGTKYEFDPNALTFGEGREIEKVTGQPFRAALASLRTGDLTTMQAVVWVAMRREDKGLGFSDLDDRSIADIEFYDDEDDAPDPTGPADSESAD